MPEKNRPHRNLFLMELMIAILFFALCSAVCLRLFARSRMDSRQMQLQNAAMSRAESAANIFQSDGLDGLSHTYGIHTDGGAGQAALYYDLSWNGCDKANASYVMTLSWDRKDHMETLSLTVADTDGTDALYSLSARHHVPYTLNDREAAP